MRRVLIVLFLLSSLLATADDSINTITPAVHAARHRITSKQDQLMMFDNPYVSVLGFITKADIFRYHDGLVTSIAIQPLGLSQIFEVNLAFCGNEGERMRGKTGLVVITYRRQKDIEYCYDLFDIRQTINTD